jgi:hypothetical protein
MSHRTKAQLVVLGLALVLAPGCALGLNSVLFVTKTATAIDIDGSPPTLDIGYGRKETIIAPVFRGDADRPGDRTLPVLSSVAQRQGFLEFGSSHSFATGDAALVLGDAFTSEDEYVFGNKNSVTKVRQPDMRGVIRTSPFKSSMRFGGDDTRKRYAFGTDTSLGLTIGMSATATPTSVALGFKRKERAYIPLLETKVGNDVIVSLPSLLATADAAAQWESQDSSGAVVGQLFATGDAATLLSKHAGVRRVLGPKILGEPELFEAVNLSGLGAVARAETLLGIYKGLEGLAKAGDEGAELLVARLDEMAKAIGSVEFAQYESEPDKDKPGAMVLQRRVPKTKRPVTGFVSLNTVMAILETSVDELDAGLAPALAVTPVPEKLSVKDQGGTAKDEMVVDLRAESNTMRDRHLELLQALEGNVDVREALQYFIDRLTTAPAETEESDATE